MKNITFCGELLLKGEKLNMYLLMHFPIVNGMHRNFYLNHVQNLSNHKNASIDDLKLDSVCLDKQSIIRYHLEKYL